MPPSECRLCGSVATLRRGHVIPKFATRWIKKNSVKTRSRLRQAYTGRLMQDGTKVRMFCGDCEQLLARDENAFNQHAFGDSWLRATDESPIHYEEWMLRFACGLMLRAGIAHLLDESPLFDTPPHYTRLVESACNDLRSYLLGQAEWPGKLHPIRLSVGFERIPSDGHRTQWSQQMTAGVDTTTVQGSNFLAIYVQIPFHVFWLPIMPKRVREQEWTNCRIKKRGVFKLEQRAHTEFWEFLAHRFKVTRPAYEQARRSVA